jgi:hypothetical protein
MSASTRTVWIRLNDKPMYRPETGKGSNDPLDLN